MRKLLLLFALPIAMCSAQTSHPLTTLIDKNRVLLLCAPTPQDPRLQAQIDLLQPHSAEMHDRDLITIPVLAHWDDSALSRALRARHAPIPSNAEQADIRRRFHIAPADFTVILLGKDGGEKFRSATPVTMDTLNKLIDAMPMRQQEIRNQNPK